MVKSKRSKTNGDMPVQIITGRDGKPAFAVVPFEAFSTLLTYARKGANENSDDFGPLKKLEWNWNKLAANNDEDVAVYDEAKARKEESFPLEIADRMIGGENPTKVFREYRGLTQKQLAKKTGTSAAYLSQIETGRRTGSIRLLRRLAGALDVEVEDLI